MFKNILIFTVLLASSFSVNAEKETDMMWYFLSNDDPRGIYVIYPLRGAAQVQVGAVENLTLAEAKAGKEDGRDNVRFDFNDNNESSIIITGGREGAEISNVFRAGYYDFAKIEGDTTISATQYFCLSAVPKEIE